MVNIPQNYHELPKFSDGLSYLYCEHCKIEKEKESIALYKKSAKIPIPCAELGLMLLGPGTSITHAAVRILSRFGCLISWVGEQGVRFYAQGLGKTRSAKNLLHQARLYADPSSRLQVVRRMYLMRFHEVIDSNLSIQQLRGREGARIKQAYARASEEFQVPWHGRTYNRTNWNQSDAINRALSSANACLYGLCHAAIVTAGYSPSIGFIHTGKILSFVYDIADLYKVDLTIPLAFQIVSLGKKDIGRRVRTQCRDLFYKSKLLPSIIPDIQNILDISTKSSPEPEKLDEFELNTSESIPSGLWDPESGVIEGGKNYEDE